VEKYFLNYVRLYITYLTLMVNVVQQHNFQRKTRNKQAICV